VESRQATGGHGVPEDKIRSRYIKSLNLIPELVEIADVMHIYDNSTIPYRIFKKRKTEYFIWENENWSKDTIKKLVGKDVWEM
jgi:predicted ABC-type ATPase